MLGRRFASYLFAAAVLCAPSEVAARPVHAWQLDELAKAPVLVVGHILAVQKDGPARDKSFWWSNDSWEMTADLLVLRAHTASGVKFGNTHINIHYFGCCTRSVVSGPDFPQIESGRTYVFPLRTNKDPASQPWELLGNEGPGLTLPAHDEMAFSEPPTTSRSFLLREIANVLARGTPDEVAAAGRCLSNQLLDLTPGLMPLMEPAIGDERKRWAEIAATILATTGVPRPSIKELFSEELVPERWHWQKSSLIARAALRKLGPSPETDDLLIKTLVEDAPFHAWGSATVLLEFADNPVATETLRRALRDDQPGSSYIAWTFAHAGHRAVLKEALARALKVADRPSADLADLQGAAALLRDFGSDRDLDALARLVRKYQTQNRKFYSMLWQWSTEAGNPHEVRVLAVVLKDRTPISNNARVCDLALSLLERATGKHFSADGTSISARDAAVASALSWIKAQGIREWNQ